MNEHKLLALIAKEIAKEKASQVDFLSPGERKTMLSIAISAVLSEA